MDKNQESCHQANPSETLTLQFQFILDTAYHRNAEYDLAKLDLVLH